MNGRLREIVKLVDEHQNFLYMIHINGLIKSMLLNDMQKIKKLLRKEIKKDAKNSGHSIIKGDSDYMG